MNPYIQVGCGIAALIALGITYYMIAKRRNKAESIKATE